MVLGLAFPGEGFSWIQIGAKGAGGALGVGPRSKGGGPFPGLDLSFACIWLAAAMRFSIKLSIRWLESWFV